MIHSIKGEIVGRGEDSVYVAVGDLTFELHVYAPGEWKVGDVSTYYVDEVLTQEEHYFVGFKSEKEKEAYRLLLLVKGIGPKTSLSIVSSRPVEKIYEALAREDVSYLTKIPGIGSRSASQMVLDLRGKLPKDVGSEGIANTPYEGVYKALLGLGFPRNVVEAALAELPEGLEEGAAIKEALRRIG